MTETRSLHKKLAQVMYEAERIPKRGKAPAAMGGFDFVQVGDAADYIRKALAEKGISMMPSQVEVVGETEHATKTGGTMTTLELRVTWTLTDGDSGESAVIQSFGAGADTGDKYSGKAMTNAMKYALLAGFLLSTGDDVELSDTSDRGRKPPRDTQLPPPQAPHEGGLIGVAELAKSPHDYEPRQGPEGMVIGFGLKEGRQIVRVIAHGPLAEALATVREQVIGKRVECFGLIEPDEWTVNAGTKQERTIPYLRLILSRIVTPDFVLPANDAANADAARGGVVAEAAAEPLPPLDSEIAELPMFAKDAA